MQVTLTPSSAAEARLLAAFINDLADFMELGAAPTSEVAEAVTAPAAPPRKPRSKKGDTPPAATDAAQVEAPEAGKSTAQDASEPGESSAGEAGSTGASPDSPDASSAPVKEVSLDDLRVLFGTLTQEGKRAQAVAIVRGAGANGLAEIPEDKRADVYAQMKAL